MLTPAEIRAISDDLGGASETARRLGVERRTVSRWRAGDSAPERPGDLIDAWCVAQIERTVTEMTKRAARASTLKGQTVTLRGTVPGAISTANAAAMRARLRQLTQAVFENVPVI